MQIHIHLIPHLLPINITYPMLKAIKAVLLPLIYYHLHHVDIVHRRVHPDELDQDLLLGCIHCRVEALTDRVEVLLNILLGILVQGVPLHPVALVVLIFFNSQEEKSAEAVQHPADGLLDVEVVGGVAGEEAQVLELEGVVLGLGEELVLLETLSAADVHRDIITNGMGYA